MLLAPTITLHHPPCRPLLDAAVVEDERAAVVWSAPFILLVLDDSRQQQLEYSNAAASTLFGRDYLDLLGTPGHDLVAAEGDAQVLWVTGLMWCCGCRCLCLCTWQAHPSRCAHST